MRKSIVLFGAILFSLCLLIEAQEKNFIFAKKPTIIIPGVIQIGCLGFKGDGGEEFFLNFSHYQKYLENLYKILIPNSKAEAYTYVRYYLRYRLETVQTKIVDFESQITTRIKNQFPNKVIPETVNIDIDNDITNYLLKIYDAFEVDAGWNTNKYAILLVNPSFSRMKDNLKKEGYNVDKFQEYRWLFNTVPTNVWISKGKFVVIDVTATPVYVGPSFADSGVRSPLSIPKLSECESNDQGRRLEFEAGLGVAIYSAVEHLFFADISFTPYTSAWDRIFIPILIFKNHNDPVNVNQPVVYQQLRRIFHSDIQIDVKFGGTHSLHDHKHLSMAVSKSLRTHITHELNRFGFYETIGRQYIDSETLHAELQRSTDLIAEQFLEDKTGSNAQNKKTLPVFIFSLHGYDKNLLLDDYELLSVLHDSIIILTTDQQDIPVPLYVDMDDVTINATDPTRHIIAGVAINQGVTVPYEKYSHRFKRMDTDYCWALGHHPFGPFADDLELSELFINSINRNSIVSRIQKGITDIRDSLKLIDEFAEKYFHGVLESGDDFTSWLEAAYNGKDPVDDPLLYTNVVERLYTQVISLSDKLHDISSNLRQFKNDEAFALSQTFVYGANIFSNYVKQELEEAEIRLMCCNIHHIPPSNVVLYGAIALGMTLFAVIVPLFMLVGYMFMRNNTATKRVKPASGPLIK